MVQDIGELEQEVRRDPRMRRFHELAREYQRLGRMDEAAVLCEKGLALNPNQWQARNLLAQIYLAKGRLDEARVQVEKVLLALPDNIPANHLAADIYYAMGDRERAFRHYKVVDLFDPGRANVAERLRELEEGEERKTGPSAQPPAEPLPAEAPEEVFPSEAPSEEVFPEGEPEPLAVTSGEATPEARSEAQPSPAATAAVLEEAPLPEAPAALPGEAAEGEASFLDLLEPETAPVEAADGGAREVPLEDTERDETLLASDDTQEAVLELEGGQGEPTGGEETGPAAPAFNTVTLARLYEAQGYPEKAVEVYQRILLKEPDNAEVREKVRSLLRRMAGEAPEAPAVQQEDVRKALRRRRVEILENWLRRVREGSHV